MVDEIVERLDRDGYAILENALPAEQIAAARKELGEILARTPSGRDRFEGLRTRRIYSLFAKTRTLDALALHPTALGVLERVLGHYQLSAPAAIAIGPGEEAQPLHRDEALYPVPRPHPEIVASIMWPLDDFSEANGGTRMVPGSHRRDENEPPSDLPCISLEPAVGSAVFYLGSVWHGGGANRTERDRLGVVLHYAAGWLRPAENHVLAVPPEVASALPQRLQELLGYNICPPFIGYVNGRHPRHLLTQAPG